MATKSKTGGKSKYKYVSLEWDSTGKERWTICIYGNRKPFDTEREAAIAVDKKLIEKGKKPVNILVPKSV
jgi:hypothetical protein